MVVPALYVGTAGFESSHRSSFIIQSKYAPFSSFSQALMLKSPRIIVVLFFFFICLQHLEDRLIIWGVFLIWGSVDPHYHQLILVVVIWEDCS